MIAEVGGLVLEVAQEEAFEVLLAGSVPALDIGPAELGVNRGQATFLGVNK